MDLKIPAPTLKSVQCSITITFLLLVEFILLRTFFNKYYSSFIPVILVMLAGVGGGLIFGEIVKNSIIHLMIISEILIIVYLFITFAFNPWGNATHIPPTLNNILILPLVVIIFSFFGFIVITLFTIVMVRSGNFGIKIRKLVYKH